MINSTIVIPHLGKNAESKLTYKLTVESLQKTCPWPIVTAFNGLEVKERTLGTKDLIVARQGQCSAVNAAVGTVNTEWVYVTNDDMIHPPGWWEKLSAIVEKNDIKCLSPVWVVPKNDFPPPFVHHYCGDVDTGYNHEKFLEFAKTYKDEKLETGFNTPFLIKKELWDLIGGYDINYDPWGSNSDSDLQAKIHLSGTQTWRYRDVIVYHFFMISGTYEAPQNLYWHKNMEYFEKKWGFPRQADDVKVWGSEDIIDYDRLAYLPKWRNFYGKL